MRSKLIIMKLKQHQLISLSLSGVFIVNLEHIQHINVIYPGLTLDLVLAVGVKYTQQTFVLMKTSSRRLDEDEYILITHTSSEDVFKTFSRHLQDVFKTSSRRLQNVFETSRKYILKTSSRSFEDVTSS